MAREKAEAASEAKSRFLAIIVCNPHPLERGPGNGAAAVALALTLEQREQALAIDKSGRTLLSILNDVLDLAKIEAGQMPLEQSDFSPGGCRTTFSPCWPRSRGALG
ncbi:MAG: hypothetical protein U5L98_18370 [Halomonas sp.]|uniref:hypothetical protein n=1 Tax=Halomonas sp. TaxID=1486246 RepID=UPI002ACE63B4|nr:hypothetical protein [Halomonas sp.]MDZ7854538.1 hypothetical protein [Halomonas sp.]